MTNTNDNKQYISNISNVRGEMGETCHVLFAVEILALFCIKIQKKYAVCKDATLKTK